MKQKAKPEVGKQYTFEDKIIEVTSISDNGFYYKTVGGTGGRLRLAEYGSPLHESMKIYEKKETNYEHYKRDIAETIVQYGCLVFKHREAPKGIYFKPTETNIKDVIKWFEEEYKEPIQMTLFEHSILECAVNHGYEWIARDSTSSLNIYPKKPLKNRGEWGITQWEVYLEMSLFEDKFQFIQWSDEEPYHIPTLLEECEVVDQ